MPKILDNVNSPDDLKKLKVADLKLLSEEIREEIINVVSKNGGHLSSNLGVIELTIALLKVFSPPQDKIIFDVSHQSYAYKILTGRKDRFSTIRQYKGISGFQKISESEYDSFGTGHSSTSISAALGMAFARDLKKENFNIAAVIGDGSMTGGMVFEALNNIGNMKDTNILIVLNDNEMSISPNVGSIASYFNKMITGNFYNVKKEDIESFIKRKFTKIGEKLVQASHKVEESIKGLIFPGMVFEEFGLRYFGPIDGNDLDQLLPVIERLKDIKGPNILHILTKKGMGYKPSESDPEFFHSSPTFDIETGEVKSKTTSWTKVFGDAVCELAEKDESIIAITAAMMSGTGLSDFAEKFPKRFLDVGIAEQHAVTTAAGMATQGIKPIVAVYSTFLQRGFDQVIHDVALQNLNVVFCLDRAGIVGNDGPTHHGVFDLGYLRMIPNMVVMAPKDGNELRNMLYTAVNYNKGPVAIRYPRGNCSAIENGFIEIKIGEPEIIINGKDVAILAIGNFVEKAVAVAKILKDKFNKEITVVNTRFVKPISIDFLKKVFADHKHVFTMEDNNLMGGFGSGINELVEEHNLADKPCVRFGFPDQFVEHGNNEFLYRDYGLNPDQIAKKIAEELNLKK